MISVFQQFPFVQAGFCNAKESAKLQHPILMKQVHSADVLVLTEVPSEPPKCDALATKTPSLRLTVKTADCTPVLFLDPVAKVIAATHAGWKGAFQGVLETTVLAMLKMGASLNNIHAAIGPHLTQKSFQVQEDMQTLFSPNEQQFFHETPNGTFFDFTGYVRHRLDRIGINNVELFDLDTYTNPEYNSYRRDKENPARQYSFIELTKGV
ncbi:MAG: peptidoglycan editing factor PgeF [Alphaproteobacteria bacterium]|nr:peptidoglycan editing factor PgeF [Alphaproteobacteria bacterium]